MNLCITAINSYLDFTEYQGIRLKSLHIQQKPFLDNVISQDDYVLLWDSLLRDGELSMTVRGISMGLKRFAEKYGTNQDVAFPHSFRHRFAKNFIERKPDIALLADLMGHESLETTRVYLRRTASEQRAAVDEAVIW